MSRSDFQKWCYKRCARGCAARRSIEIHANRYTWQVLKSNCCFREEYVKFIEDREAGK